MLYDKFGDLLPANTNLPINTSKHSRLLRTGATRAKSTIREVQFSIKVKMADAPVKAGTVTSLASKFGGMKRIVGGMKSKSKRLSCGSNDNGSGLEGGSLSSEQEASSLERGNSAGGQSEVEERSTFESQRGTEWCVYPGAR